MSVPRLSELVEMVDDLGTHGDARIVGTLMITHPEILAGAIETVKRTIS